MILLHQTNDKNSLRLVLFTPLIILFPIDLNTVNSFRELSFLYNLHVSFFRSKLSPSGF